MLITKEIQIDMGHRVPNHKSKCRNLHGHRYKIRVGVEGNIIDTKGESEEGMVIDFGDLKDIMIERIDKFFDHGFVVQRNDLYANFFDQMSKDGLKIIWVDFVPTAENLAKLWFDMIKEPLKRSGIKLHHVTVFETPTSTAIYDGNG